MESRVSVYEQMRRGNDDILFESGVDGDWTGAAEVAALDERFRGFVEDGAEDREGLVGCGCSACLGFVLSPGSISIHCVPSAMTSETRTPRWLQKAC